MTEDPNDASQTGTREPEALSTRNATSSRLALVLHIHQRDRLHHLCAEAHRIIQDPDATGTFFSTKVEIQHSVLIRTYP